MHRVRVKPLLEWNSMDGNTPSGPTGIDVDVSVARRVERTQHPLRALTWSLTVLGVGAFVLLLQRLGGGAVLAGLRSLGRLWPLLLSLEVGRLGCELAGTRALLGAAAARVPLVRLIRGQLIGHALDVVMPAGRAVAEAAKAAVYAREVGGPQAAAIATALQLSVLFANALWALVGCCVSGRLGLPAALRVGLLGYTGATCLLVLGVCVFAASPRMRAVFARSPMLHASLERFATLLEAAPGRVAVAVLAQLVGRGVQASQLALAGTLLGAQFSLSQVALAQAVLLVGGALGDLVPAQLGMTDSAVVLAAPTLGMTQAAAFSSTVALHAVQVLMAGLAALAAFAFWYSERRVDRGTFWPGKSRAASRRVAKLPQTF